MAKRPTPLLFRGLVSRTSEYSAQCPHRLRYPHDAEHRSRRLEVNETRLFAAFPPYLDVDIVFYTFVRTILVRNIGAQSGL